jgi:hypothetical protein
MVADRALSEMQAEGRFDHEFDLGNFGERLSEKERRELAQVVTTSPGREDHDGRRMFVETNAMVQVTRIAAMLYYREHGEAPAELSDLDPEVFPLEDYRNQTGFFDPGEVFLPFHMKTVSLIPDESTPYTPPNKRDPNHLGHIISDVAELLLGGVVIEGGWNDDHYIDYQYDTRTDGLGNVIYNNRTARLTMDSFTGPQHGVTESDPVPLLARKYIVENNRSSMVQNVVMSRVLGLEVGRSIPPPHARRVAAVTEEEVLDSATRFLELARDSCDRTDGLLGSFAGVERNGIQVTVELEFPDQVFAVYSAGPDGVDNGGTRDYRYYTSTNVMGAERWQADIVTFILPEEMSRVSERED